MVYPLAMVGLRVEINRFVEEGQPNVVQCRFRDAHGEQHFIVEKVPVISTEELGPNDTYPRPDVIPCTVIRKKVDGGIETVEIDTMTPLGIESIAGQSLFDVRPDQLVQIRETK